VNSLRTLIHQTSKTNRHRPHNPSRDQDPTHLKTMVHRVLRQKRYNKSMHVSQPQ